MIKPLKTLFLSALLLFGVAGCGSQPGTKTVFATDIKLDQTSLSLIYDDNTKNTATLTATVTPANYNHGTIAWSFSSSYASTYLEITPSADKKSCVVKGLKAADDAYNVVATIAGETKDLSASCAVSVTKTPVHVTSVEFGQTKSATIGVKEQISVDFTVAPTDHDDNILVEAADTSIVTAGIIDGKVTIVGKMPGTTTLKLIAMDKEQKEKCRSQSTFSVTVSEPASLPFYYGASRETPFTTFNKKAGEYNIFMISMAFAADISSTSLFEASVRPTTSQDVDTTKINATVGLTAASAVWNWIVVGTGSKVSSSALSETKSLEMGKKYFLVIQNLTDMASDVTSITVKITMPNSITPKAI